LWSGFSDMVVADSGLWRGNNQSGRASDKERATVAAVGPAGKMRPAHTLTFVSAIRMPPLGDASD
jgi:hypothetical protein